MADECSGGGMKQGRSAAACDLEAPREVRREAYAIERKALEAQCLWPKMDWKLNPPPSQHQQHKM
jgi:hypothetical protein